MLVMGLCFLLIVLLRFLVIRIGKGQRIGAVAQLVLGPDRKQPVLGPAVDGQLQLAVFQGGIELPVHIDASNTGTRVGSFHGQRLIANPGLHNRRVVIKEIYGKNLLVFRACKVGDKEIHRTIGGYGVNGSIVFLQHFREIGALLRVFFVQRCLHLGPAGAAHILDAERQRYRLVMIPGNIVHLDPVLRVGSRFLCRRGLGGVFGRRFLRLRICIRSFPRGRFSFRGFRRYIQRSVFGHFHNDFFLDFRLCLGSGLLCAGLGHGKGREGKRRKAQKPRQQRGN